MSVFFPHSTLQNPIVEWQIPFIKFNSWLLEYDFLVKRSKMLLCFRQEWPGHYRECDEKYKTETQPEELLKKDPWQPWRKPGQRNASRWVPTFSLLVWLYLYLSWKNNAFSLSFISHSPINVLYTLTLVYSNAGSCHIAPYFIMCGTWSIHLLMLLYDGLICNDLSKCVLRTTLPNLLVANEHCPHTNIGSRQWDALLRCHGDDERLSDWSTCRNCYSHNLAMCLSTEDLSIQKDQQPSGMKNHLLCFSP